MITISSSSSLSFSFLHLMKRKGDDMATQQGKKNLGFQSKDFEEDREDDFLPQISLYL